MRKSMRKSKIIVKVLDLTGECDKALKFAKTKGGKPDAIKATTLTWGIVETNNGTYMLCEEGVGANESLEESPAKIGFHIKTTADYQECAPSIETELDIKAVKEIPIKEEINLSKFIRVFGGRLESNFNNWNNFLSQR